MLFPPLSAVNEVFSPLTPAKSQELAPKSLHTQSTSPKFSVWSVVEDAKSKANVLSEEAQREIQKASAAAQAKTGQLELYSAQYYAACTFGGLVACVGIIETSAPGLVAHK